MKVGITARFQNSYFSGSLPQVACALARTIAKGGHEVELIYPQGEQDWFNDISAHKVNLPGRVAWSKQTYDVLIEVCWNLPADERKGQKIIYFSHYPPIFNDIESCVYSANQVKRDFTNISQIWTYDLYSKQDIEYFEFLSGKPVVKVPYLWDHIPLDIFVKDEQIPLWADAAKNAEKNVPGTHPKSMSWCLRVFESNHSNSSHCIIPVNIISEIRKTVEPVRFTTHNSETTVNNEFMKNNVLKNLLLPDAQTNMIPRVRLPDTRKEKTLIVAHQRFRPMKSFLLDAIYLGIPMIHNNVILRDMGVAPYYYELNQIRDAVNQYKQVSKEYVGGTGFFGKLQEVQKTLIKRFNPERLAKNYHAFLTSAPMLSRPLPLPDVKIHHDVLRIAFATMWDGFKPEDNFFTYLLKWVGHLNNIKVVIDEVNPNLVFWGPLSLGTEQRWPTVPKVYFTGENARPNKSAFTFLNLGFDYDTSESYIRLPLWVLEINWWGCAPNQMENPKPVSVADATTAIKDRGNREFCAFVATNPTNPTRNAVFNMLNQWRPVASGGRLFCNLPTGPIPAGLGGGGGELAKIEFYKKYNFALTMENSGYPGYVTEKLFHAKVAGCVPIYWGDIYVDRDFDSDGYIQITKAKDLEEILRSVQAVVDDKSAIERMAAIPAVTPYKRKWCEKTMTKVAESIFQHITGKPVKVTDEDWKQAESFVKTLPYTASTPSAPAPPVVLSKNRIFVTAANAKYIEAAANALKSLKVKEPTVKAIVYIWPDVTEPLQKVLYSCGANELRVFPTETVKPWPDFWAPEHFAWKLWIHKTLLDEVGDDTSILYCDSGTVFVDSLTKLWAQIAAEGILAIDDPTQPNKRWCHPTFCKNMNVTQAELEANQLWAGCFGYRKGAFDAIANEALRIASAERETIVGNKWTMYNQICSGHRHDQSILSILTARARAPRVPLNYVYCDISQRAAEQFGAPLYVHRGNYKAFKPLVDGIDEGYVINLERRKDRLDKFRKAHENIKDKVYVSRAVDGRSLTLTPEMVQCFRDNDFKWKKSVMGCALSHLALWEKLANDTLAKRYLIMEDDVKFQTNWLATWFSMAPHVPQDADVIYLGGILPPNKPAFDFIKEPVNPYFAKVAKNTLTTPMARRYFHFCNYSYILTQQGAQKLVRLVKERGIFTSGDHMIVNHGDEYLNIYFTTPLLATCFQEDDPIYQKSEFNNFNRVDNFDSDLWNNTDCFTETEIVAAGGVIQKVDQQAKGEKINIWNNLLKEIALKQLNPDTLNAVFTIWKNMNDTDFLKYFGWFRIFEQFIVSRNEQLLKLKPQIVDYVNTLTGNRAIVFNEVKKALSESMAGPNEPHVVKYSLPQEEKQVIFHMPEIDPKTFLENDWLAYLFQKPIQWMPLGQTIDLSTIKNPILMYQKIPGKNPYVKAVMENLAKQIEQLSIKFVLLHLSDEFSDDDLSLYESKAFSKIIRNYWRPGLPSTIVQLPLGYTNGRSNYSYSDSPSFVERPHLWSFAGSMDRPGRQEAIEVLKKTGQYQLHEKARWETPYPQDGPEYIKTLRNSKFVPCFAGSYALESYRLYEALEHGAIPFYVATKYDEYKEMYGQSPLLGFPSWEKAAQMLPLLSAKDDVMEKHRIACLRWWKDKKQQVTNNIASRAAGQQ